MPLKVDAMAVSIRVDRCLDLQADHMLLYQTFEPIKSKII